MVSAGKRKRGFSVRACASSCLLLLQHNTTALLLQQRPGGAIRSQGLRRGFFGSEMSRSWCGVQPWRERTPTSLPCRGAGGGIQRTTSTMIFDFFDQRARSQVAHLHCCKLQYNRIPMFVGLRISVQSNIVGFIYRVGSHTGVYVEYHTPPLAQDLAALYPAPPPARSASSRSSPTGRTPRTHRCFETLICWTSALAGPTR